MYGIGNDGKHPHQLFIRYLGMIILIYDCDEDNIPLNNSSIICKDLGKLSFTLKCLYLFVCH